MMLPQGWPDWWGLVGRQSSYLLLPGHLLLYHQPPPILGHFASSLKKQEFSSILPCLYSYVAFGVNAKLSPAFEVTLTWIGLNLCKRLQKVQRDWNESRDLVPCCPGPSVAIYYTPAARPLIKKLCETIPRFPLKFQLPTPWLQKSSIGGIVTTKSNSSHFWSVKLTSLIFSAMFRIAQRLPSFEKEYILLLLPWKVFFTRTRSDLIFVFLSRSLIKLTQIPTPLRVHPHELHNI